MRNDIKNRGKLKFRLFCPVCHKEFYRTNCSRKICMSCVMQGKGLLKASERQKGKPRIWGIKKW